MPSIPTGKTGFPKWNAAVDVPDGAAQDEELGTHFDDLIGESVATASSLPSSDNWPNRTIMAEDTKVIYVWSGSGWVDQPKRIVVSPTNLTGTPGIPSMLAGQIVVPAPGSGGTYTLVFPTAFPNGIVGLWLTDLDQASGNAYVQGNSLTKTGANIAISGHGTAGYRLAYLAIGW